MPTSAMLVKDRRFRGKGRRTVRVGDPRGRRGVQIEAFRQIAVRQSDAPHAAPRVGQNASCCDSSRDSSRNSSRQSGSTAVPSWLTNASQRAKTTSEAPLQ
jgi:hypothetical protein